MVEVECFGVSGPGRLAVIDGTVNSVLSYAAGQFYETHQEVHL